jgi:hypothetical protein
MPKLDIRKQATRSSVHYAPVGEAVFDSDIARLREFTPEGRAFLAKAPDFCRLERTLIARILDQKPISKPALMAQFGFPGRVFNAAYNSAKGLVDSAKASAELALAGTGEALSRALAQYAEAEADHTRQGELGGRRRRISRLVEQEARHERLVLRPRIFPGGDFYRQQQRKPGPGWKKAFLAHRADHISANGGADEQMGNKTLQVTLGPTESINGRLWLERACEQAVKAERLSLRLNAKGRFGHTLVVADSPPPPESNGSSGRQSDSPRFPVEPALKWQVACGRKISRAFSTLADLRSASLRDQRRAAKALKRSSVRLPRFEMPSLIELQPAKPHRLASCSSLLRVA